MRPVRLLLLTGALVAPGVLLAVPATAAAPTCAGKAATIVGTSGADRVYGTKADDVVVLGAGNDTFYGDASSTDLVCLGDGDDFAYGNAGTIYGGTGRDRLYARGSGVTFQGQDGPDSYVRDTEAAGADRAFGGPGDDFFRIGIGTTSFDVGAGSRNSVAFEVPTRVGLNLAAGTWSYAGTTRDLGPGRIWIASLEDSAGGDHVVGTEGAEQVHLGAGDSASLRGGDDYAEASGSGRVTVDLGSGADELYAASGEAVGDGALGNDDATYSGTSRGSFRGGDGNDFITFFGHRRVHVNGGAGRDDMQLFDFARGVRADLTRGRLATAYATLTLTGMEDFDGTPKGDVITGTAGANDLHGSAGPDRIYGGGGNDYLNGGPGSDRIYGGAGNDLGSGETGDDVCFATEYEISCRAG